MISDVYVLLTVLFYDDIGCICILLDHLFCSVFVLFDDGVFDDDLFDGVFGDGLFFGLSPKCTIGLPNENTSE